MVQKYDSPYHISSTYIYIYIICKLLEYFNGNQLNNLESYKYIIQVTIWIIITYPCISDFNGFHTNILLISLQWHHNGGNGISNHHPHDCLLNCLFSCRSKKTSKLHVTGLCVGNSVVTSEFHPQRASNMENVSIWWCHHVTCEKVIWTAVDCN